MFSIKEATQICQNLSAEYGDTFDIPVQSENLKSGALGVTHITNTRTHRTPVSIGLSPTLLQYGTKEQVIETIKHEWVHYYLAKRQHWGHAHDAAFRAVSKYIGLDGAATLNNASSLRPYMYKYTVHCPKCGAVLAGYNKMCKSLKEIKYYQCNYCGCNDLYYQENKKGQ